MGTLTITGPASIGRCAVVQAGKGGNVIMQAGGNVVLSDCHGAGPRGRSTAPSAGGHDHGEVVQRGAVGGAAGVLTTTSAGSAGQHHAAGVRHAGAERRGELHGDEHAGGDDPGGRVRGAADAAGGGRATWR